MRTIFRCGRRREAFLGAMLTDSRPQVPRIGPQHQAGSDSLLTATTFFKMRGKFFEDAIDPKYMVRPLIPPPSSLTPSTQGVLYGLNSSPSSHPHQAHPREHHGATHYPHPSQSTTPLPAPPLAAAASAAIAILNPSPRERERDSPGFGMSGR